MASSDAAVSYASPSTLAVANFVTVKPCLEGYERSDFKIWKKQMLCLLESHEMAGFVDGGTPPPPEDEEQQKMTWRRTDVLVQGWILGSIGKDALDIVWDKPTAREMWLELETIFKEEEEEEEEEDEGADEDGFSKYLNLHQAAMRGNWDVAINFFPDRMQLSTTVITSKLETTLHIAAMTGKSNLDFVKKLVELMPPEALALKDRNKHIALDNAIVIGNIEAVKAMIKKKPDLLFFANSVGGMPVREAAVNSHREILEYLLSEHEYCYEDGVPLFKSQDGINNFERDNSLWIYRYCIRLGSQVPKFGSANIRVGRKIRPIDDF